jgi:hypothetical protein
VGKRGAVSTIGRGIVISVHAAEEDGGGPKDGGGPTTTGPRAASGASNAA